MHNTKAVFGLVIGLLIHGPALGAKQVWGVDAAGQEQLFIAFGALENGWAAMAETAADAALAADPDCGPCIRARVDALLMQGKTDKALEGLERLRKEHSRRGPYWDEYAAALFDAGRYSEARKYAKKTVGIEPDSYVARRILMLSYLRENNIDDAMRAVRSTKLEVGAPLSACLELEIQIEAGNRTGAQSVFDMCRAASADGQRGGQQRLLDEREQVTELLIRDGTDHQPSFVSVSTAGNYVCATEEDGISLCWGRFGYPRYQSDLATAGPPRSSGGQLVALTARPVVHLADIDVAWNRACGLDYSGGVHCWGYLESGVAPRTKGSWTQLDARGWGVAAVDGSGLITTWGRVAEPRGLRNQVVAEVSADVSTRADGSIAEFRRLCALGTRDELRCWQRFESVPTEVPGPEGRWRDFTMGEHRMCALDGEYQPKCWHFGAAGEIDAPESMFAPAMALKMISSGATHFCGIDKNDAVVCWGADDVLPTPEGSFVDVSVGVGRNCAVDTEGRVHCWSAEGVLTLP